MQMNDRPIGYVIGSHYLAGAIYLLLSIYPRVFLNENGRVFYEFPDTVAVHECVTKYSNNSVSLPVLSYATILKRLRQDMRNLLYNKQSTDRGTDAQSASAAV